MGLGSGIRDLRFGIRDPRSGIRDPGSEIRDPRSGIRVQGSKRHRIRIRNTADFGDDGVLCTFSNVQAAAGIAGRSQFAAEQLLGRAKPKYDMQAVRPAHHSQKHCPPPSLPARQDRTPRWVSSLRPPASVGRTPPPHRYLAFPTICKCQAKCG